MAKNRFPWGRVSELEGALELKERDCIVTLELDKPELSCWIKSCKRKLVAGNKVYVPAKSINTATNKVMGHVECIKGKCNSIKQEAAVRDVKQDEKKGLIKTVPMSGTVGKSPDASALIARIKTESFQAGYAAGREAMMAELMRELESQ